MAEFIALAKAQPGKLSYASPGHGSLGHLMGEQFKLATGTDILHVPYRGMGPALNDAVGGQVQVVYDNLPTSLELVKSGRLRALALAAPKRVEALPDVPTFGELGIEECNWMALFGLVAPKDLPPAMVRRLHEALLKVLAMPEVRGRLSGPAGHRGRQFAGRVQGRDRARAGAHAPRRGGGQDRAELARQPLLLGSPALPSPSDPSTPKPPDLRPARHRCPPTPAPAATVRALPPPGSACAV